MNVHARSDPPLFRPGSGVDDLLDARHSAPVKGMLLKQCADGVGEKDNSGDVQRDGFHLEGGYVAASDPSIVPLSALTRPREAGYFT